MCVCVCVCMCVCVCVCVYVCVRMCVCVVCFVVVVVFGMEEGVSFEISTDFLIARDESFWLPDFCSSAKLEP